MKQKLLSIARKLLKGLGFLVTFLSLLVFIGVLGENKNWLTQFGSIVFPISGRFLTLLVVIGLSGVVGLYLARRRGKKLAKSTLFLTFLSLTALILGAVEWSMTKKVVEENGGTLTLLGEMSIPLTAQPDEVVTYATKKGQDLTLSVYRNTEPFSKEKQPVYVYIHGGGWSHGDSESLSGLHREVAKQGYVVFSINYRLATSDNPTWEKATEDIADAMNWIKAHAQDYGGDSDKLILSGESAGGHLDLLYTGLVSSGQLDAPLPSAVIAMYPAVDLQWISDNARYLTVDPIPGFVETYIGGSLKEYPERVAAIDPLAYVNDNFPPVYLFHGKKDTMVDIQGSEQFVEQLNQAGGRAKLISLPFENHGINSKAFVSLLNHYAEEAGLGVVKP
jgi:acetyl esterase/lipase